MPDERFEYKFADCVLNSATRELRVRNELKQVAPRVMDLLVYLIENRARVVTKEELMALLWKGAVLSDGVLAQAVRKARSAIDDLEPEPKLIKTIQRVGYRFVHEVQAKPLAARGDRMRATPRPETDAGLVRRHDAALPAARPGPPPDVAPQWPNDAALPLISLARLRARPASRMAMFALDDEVVLWESALPAMHGSERLDALLPLAWHLRQRDSRRAVLLADEADALLGVAVDRDVASGRARMALVRGEAKWLAGELDAAGDLAKQAIALVWGSADDVTRCDANVQLAMIATDQGRPARVQAHLEEALLAANAAADAERITAVKLLTAVDAFLANPAEGDAAWTDWVRDRPSDEHLGLVALREKYEVVLCATWTGDAGKALSHCFAAIDAARASGQRRELITQMTNGASRLCLLGDVEAAFDWLDPALQMARAAEWPMLVAIALQQGAHVLKAVGRTDEAAEFLDESLELLGKFPRSRTFCGTLYYLAFLQFDRGQFGKALESFDQLLAAANEIGATEIITKATDGRARALASVGRTEEALATGLVALEQASVEGCRAHLPFILEGLAHIHGHPGVPAPDGIEEGSAKLHFLLRAVAAHESIGKHPVRAMLWELLAAEYARLGDYERAYATQRRAAAAHETSLTTGATNRAVAMKVRYDTERARADSAHQRALAAAQAERAEALARTNAILDRLSRIGQEIAKQHSVVGVFVTLERHVHELLDTSTLAVFVIDEGGDSLHLAFGIESGKPLPDIRVDVNDFDARVARCWRERREILADAEADGDHPYSPTPGTLQTRSALYAPLAVGARMLGVLTIQSLQHKAYGERERLVFRTLAAYGAIALDHALAYQRLEAMLEPRHAGEPHAADLADDAHG